VVKASPGGLKARDHPSRNWLAVICGQQARRRGTRRGEADFFLQAWQTKNNPPRTLPENV